MKMQPEIHVKYDLMLRVYSGIVSLSEMPVDDSTWRDSNGDDAATLAYRLRTMLEADMQCLMTDARNG